MPLQRPWARAIAWGSSLDVNELRRVVVVGFVLRVALWLVSDGSNDIRTWQRFATDIADHGVLLEYRFDHLFNHPPLMGVWAELALAASQALHVPFAQVFKLLPMGADAAAVPVLLFFARRRGGDAVAGWRAAAVFAINPASIWITAHHGNTDAMCAFLAFAAAALVDDGAFPFEAGLVLAASVNVKLIPLVLLPGLFVMQAKTLRAACGFAAGFGIGLLPFAAPLLFIGPGFYHNAISYNSSPNRWGIHFFAAEARSIKHLAHGLRTIDQTWARAARYAIMAASLAFGIWGRASGRRALDVASRAIAVFLVLAPGIGVQYFCFPVLPLCATSPRRGFIYAMLGGLFVSAIYLSFVTQWLPLVTVHHASFEWPIAAFGVLTWLFLLYVATADLVRARPVR